MAESFEQFFYVHIVESPSPSDFLNGLTEGRALCSFLEMAGIQHQYNVAVNAEQFTIAMTDRFRESWSKFKCQPILHLSAHGNTDGIALTSQHERGDLIRWHDLGRMIKPIHDAYGGCLGVCMSSCEGLQGMRMFDVIEEADLPFAWIIGPETKVDVRDAALAFSVLYRRMQCNNVENVIEAMRAASGVDGFEMICGETSQKHFAQTQAPFYTEWALGRTSSPMTPPPSTESSS